MTSTRTRGENICDECGLPMSICNAKALFELAVRRNGREAVIAAILDAQTEQPETTENYADPGSSSPSAATPASETVAEALEIVNRVFQFNLNNMIVWGDDYNQAVKDAADAVATALRALKGGDANG